MSLAADLLEQARHLAKREKAGPPRQASLRRAVSAAYYALFHLLAESAAIACAPVDPPALRSRIQRALDHSSMKEVCNRIVSSHRLTSTHASLLPTVKNYSVELIEVAEVFVELQEARHVADYDTQQKHARTDVLRLIEQVARTFSSWDAIRTSAEANVFLADMYFGKRWGR